MNKTELQNKLDLEKWLASEKANTDLSGKMDYCKVCSFAKNEICTISHLERVDKNACAESKEIESKYIGVEFDDGYVCTEVRISNIQGKSKKSPGTKNYSYILRKENEEDLVVNSTDIVKLDYDQITVKDLKKKSRKKSKK